MFVAVAVERGWFPNDMVRELIRIMALYVCSPMIYGSGMSGYSDGPAHLARFSSVLGVCLSVGSSSNDRLLMCADMENHRIRKIDLDGGGVVSTLSALTGIIPFSVCPDPLNAECYYMGDSGAVRYATDGMIVAGSDDPGDADGVGTAARFSDIHGLIATANGRTLYATGNGHHRLKSIDLDTLRVETICGNGGDVNRDGVGTTTAALARPISLCFDRSAARAESVIFITAERCIRRFDIETGTVPVRISASRWWGGDSFLSHFCDL